MSLEKVLSPERKKFLRSRHPLYTRLSGDVVWGLFEESGYSAEACEKAMDAFIAGMYAVLSVMDQLEANEATYLVVHGDGNVCEACRPLLGKAVSRNNPAWWRFVPPFAVGCAMNCAALTETDIRKNGYAMVSSHVVSPPRCPLVCPLLDKPE